VVDGDQLPTMMIAICTTTVTTTILYPTTILFVPYTSYTCMYINYLYNNTRRCHCCLCVLSSRRSFIHPQHRSQSTINMQPTAAVSKQTADGW
jgi:hypothetical protein